MRRYLLPLLSGIGIAAAAYPLYWWPLAVVALGPFFYFAGGTSRSKQELFVGGAVTGGIVGFCLVAFSLFQLQIELSLPLFYLFVYICGCLGALFVSAAFGVLAFVYNKLRGPVVFINALVGASLYTLYEIVCQYIASGYYYESLAHSLAPLPLSMLYASMGGAFFVSFLAALCSSTIAEFFHIKKETALYTICSVIFLFILVSAFGVAAYIHKSAPTQTSSPLTVAVVQFSNTQWHKTAYGEKINGFFSSPSVEPFITAAATKETSLVLYPYGVTSRAFDEQELTQMPPTFTDRNAIGAWLQMLVPTTTTVVAWDNFQKDSSTYSELVYWRADIESVYQKRILHPFSDYMPLWLQKIGFTQSPHAYIAGSYQNQVTINGVAVGSLICSEIEQQPLARFDSSRSAFLISIGSDAIFPGSMSGNYSLASARYRAAENNINVVRGNIIGPSAIINPDGSLRALLPYDTGGILRGTVPTVKGQTTLFGWFGSVPLYICISLVLIAAACRKWLTL